MPTIRVKLPGPGGANFAHRAKLKGGLSGLLVRANTVLPGGNIFKGLGAMFGTGAAIPPGPNVFAPYLRRGMGVFALPVAKPLLPGPNVFQKYMGGRPFPTGTRTCPASCSKCSKTCGRRGMGQTPDEEGYATAYDGGADTSGWTPAPVTLPANLVGPAFSLDTLPMSDLSVQSAVATLAPSTSVYNPNLSPTQNQFLNTLAPSAVAGASSALQASDLAQEQANYGLTPQQQAAINAAVAAGKITAAQAAQVSNQVGAANPTSSSLSTWLASQSLVAGYANGTVLAGSAAAVAGLVLLTSVMKSKKGKR
jgi:hypothetical protein